MINNRYFPNSFFADHLIFCLSLSFILKSSKSQDEGREGKFFYCMFIYVNVWLNGMIWDFTTFAIK